MAEKKIGKKETSMVLQKASSDEISNVTSAPDEPTSVSKFFTSVAVPESLLQQGAAYENMEFSKNQKRLLWLAASLLFLFFFFIGFFIFFPLNRGISEILNQDYPPSWSSSVEKVRVSFLGKIFLQNYQLENYASQPPLQLTVAKAKGRVPTLPLLFNRQSRGEMQIENLKLQLPLGGSTLNLEKGNWQFLYEGKFIKDKPELSFLQGEISPQNVIIFYNDVVPFLNEKISLLLQKGNLSFTVENQTLVIAPSTLESDMAHFFVRGRVPLGGNSGMNLDVTITPQALFFNKYAEMGIQQLLTSMNILKSDGTIRLQILGAVNNPQVQIAP